MAASVFRISRFRWVTVVCDQDTNIKLRHAKGMSGLL